MLVFWGHLSRWNQGETTKAPRPIEDSQGYQDLSERSTTHENHHGKTGFEPITWRFMMFIGRIFRDLTLYSIVYFSIYLQKLKNINLWFRYVYSRVCSSGLQPSVFLLATHQKNVQTYHDLQAVRITDPQRSGETFWVLHSWQKSVDGGMRGVRLSPVNLTKHLIP